MIKGGTRLLSQVSFEPTSCSFCPFSKLFSLSSSFSSSPFLPHLPRPPSSPPNCCCCYSHYCCFHWNCLPSVSSTCPSRLKKIEITTERNSNIYLPLNKHCLLLTNLALGTSSPQLTTLASCRGRLLLSTGRPSICLTTAWPEIT